MSRASRPVSGPYARSMFVPQSPDRVPRDQVDGGAPEATTGHARGGHPGRRAGDADQRIEFGRADLEIVAQAGVTGRPQLADGREVAGGERLRGGQHAGVLGDHVARPAERDVVEGGTAAGEEVQVDVAQRVDVGVQLREDGHRLLALRPAIVVGRPGGQLMGHARVDDDELVGRQGQRDLAPGQVAAIEEERRAGDPMRRGELIHEPGSHPDVAVLRTLADAGQRQRVHLRPRRPGEGPGRGQLQRGGRREAGALRQVGRQDAREGGERLTGPLELERRARQVVDPVVLWRADAARA